MNINIKTFGKLIDDGDSGDHKRTFITDGKDNDWQAIRIEIDTDDCDRKHALEFKAALLALWNNQA